MTFQPNRSCETLPVHFPYSEVDQNLLETISGTKPQQLHHDAAQAFRQMQIASKQAGIDLVPLSGFRSWQTQAKLFQQQIQRRGSETAAMELSAPPGFSEHHTGYALDIGDGQVPESHLEVTFAKTPAFLWLQIHAHQYGFELSFLPDNPQKISYEPWHWRYVNTPEAKAIFLAARGT